MGTAALIRERRLALGLQEGDVADKLGLSAAAYADVETFDDELATAVTLSGARELAAMLRVPLVDLLVLRPSGRRSVSITQCAELLRKRAAADGHSVDDLEDELGCPLAGFLLDPDAEAAEEPIVFLQNLAQYLEVDLHGLLAGDAA